MSNQLAKPATTLKSLVESPAYAARFTQVLGDKAQQFVSSLIQISGSGPLREADPHSVISAGMIAAALDLPINPNLGFAYIIPYAGKASFQMGYKGFVQLALRSGQLKQLNVIEVYEGELEGFDRLRGDFKFNPEGRKKNAGVIGYAAYMQLVNGFEHAEYWPLDAVKDHATRFSQAYKKKRQDSPWFTDFDAMAKKTVLKSMLSHWAPLSVGLVKAITEDMGSRTSPDAALEFPDAPKLTEGAVDEAHPGTDATVEAIAQKPKPTTPQAELEDFRETGNVPFDRLRECAVSLYPAMKGRMDSCASCQDISIADARLLLRNTEGVLQWLKENPA